MKTLHWRGIKCNTVRPPICLQIFERMNVQQIGRRSVVPFIPHHKRYEWLDEKDKVDPNFFLDRDFGKITWPFYSNLLFLLFVVFHWTCTSEKHTQNLNHSFLFAATISSLANFSTWYDFNKFHVGEIRALKTKNSDHRLDI